MSWIWRLPERELALGDRTRVMGILNVTPDSFSDGGRHLAPEAATDHAHHLIAEGADLIDVGGESTRPGAPEVPVAIECERVLPVIRSLKRSVNVPISIDTRKAEVARRAVAEGAEIVNDVSGLGHDPAMVGVVAAARAGLVIMHMQGEPRTMQVDPRYEDVTAEIGSWLGSRLAFAIENGVSAEQVVLDPGIGFGKRLEHNVALLANPEPLMRWGRPVLVGVSRKSMFGELLDLRVTERLSATTASIAVSAFLGVAVVRAHDVRAAVHAVRVADALRRSRHAQPKDLGSTLEPVS